MAADYYNTLSVNKNASQDEIKKAYRTLAHKHHPDKQGGNEAKFKEINEAYQVLSDPKKRQQYDQFGSAFGGGSPDGGYSGQWQGGFDGFDFSQGFGGFSQGGGINIEDVFDMFGSSFGGFGGRRTEAEGRGHDMEMELTVTLPEVLLGAHKIVSIEKDTVCETCGGNGARYGSGLAACSACDGKGEIRERVSTLFGAVMRVRRCETCKGTGKIPKELCPDCKGNGRRRGTEKLEFDIPSGIKDGETLILRKKGQAGFRSASPGDLHLRARVRMPRKLSRRARELVEELARELDS